MVNAGYIDYVLNFAAFAHRFKFPLLVLCLDDASVAAISPVFSCVRFDLRTPVAHELTTFGTQPYKRIVFAKLDAMAFVMRVLKSRGTGNQWVGYMDTDIVLLADPQPAIFAAMDAHPEADVFTQCDEGQAVGTGECSNQRACPNGCTGVLVISNTTEAEKAAKIEAALAYTAADMDHFETDQHYLMERLRLLEVPRWTLSRHVLVNGAYAKCDSASRRPGPVPRPVLPASAVLLHFNYLTGSAKEALMRKWGWWARDKVVALLKDRAAERAAASAAAASSSGAAASASAGHSADFSAAASGGSAGSAAMRAGSSADSSAAVGHSSAGCGAGVAAAGGAGSSRASAGDSAGSSDAGPSKDSEEGTARGVTQQLGLRGDKFLTHRTRSRSRSRSRSPRKGKDSRDRGSSRDRD